MLFQISRQEFQRLPLAGEKSPAGTFPRLFRSRQDHGIQAGIVLFPSPVFGPGRLFQPRFPGQEGAGVGLVRVRPGVKAEVVPRHILQRIQCLAPNGQALAFQHGHQVRARVLPLLFQRLDQRGRLFRRYQLLFRQNGSPGVQAKEHGQAQEMEQEGLHQRRRA